MEARKFFIDEYIDSLSARESSKDKVVSFSKGKHERFNHVCNNVNDFFNQEWDNEQNLEKQLERQKNAIIGKDKEVNFYKDKINEYLRANNLASTWYPSYYKNLVEAIFHENWGLAGIAEWLYSDIYKYSSSAKIIGDRVYFMENGRLVLQTQKITYERREQLRRALLLKTPKKRMDKNYAEVYMENGTRITIYGEGLTKDGQDTIVFRKYIVPKYTFERQAELGTIPREAIPMFKAMVKVGYNVAFTGAVRTAKTTFLETWQSYEDPSLEGVMVETDPEINLHKIMPNSPVIQLIADGEDLKGIVKSLMRSDADYIIMAEARDGIALNTAVKVANKGTRRVKLTFHTTDTIDFCYDVADEICNVYGGDLYSNIIKVAKSFNYVFQFIQLSDKSKKRLKGIYETRYNPINNEISVHQICKYMYKEDKWTFNYSIGPDKENIGYEEDSEAYKVFSSELKRLSDIYPMHGENVFVPVYKHLRGGV